MGFEDGLAAGSDDVKLMSDTVTAVGASGSALMVTTLAQVHLAAP